MEPEGSLPHSQASATYPCPEPDQSITSNQRRNLINSAGRVKSTWVSGTHVPVFCVQQDKVPFCTSILSLHHPSNPTENISVLLYAPFRLSSQNKLPYILESNPH